MSTDDPLFGAALQFLGQADPRLVDIIHSSGPLPERKGQPGFEGLASVVVAQLVSRQSADAIWARLIDATGPLSPQGYLAVGRGSGPRLGLTGAKADTLVRVAEAILEGGGFDLDRLGALSGEEAIRRLTAIKGIGLWTAEVHLLFNCGHPDIFPAGDLALRAAAGAAFGLPARPQAEELRKWAVIWAPHRSTAARLLWAYYGRVLRPGPAILP
nr:DNA-3-methyladenine glycosylase 2 family protein [uncultured Gellertiella sp.]